jgi:hypothetical protein
VEFPHFFFVGVIESGGPESLEQFVGAFGVYWVFAADRRMPEGVG